MKRGKVGTSGRQIMRTLWGDKGRPETNAYVDRCAEQAIRRAKSRYTSLKVVEVIKPSTAKLVESPRTRDKWAAARARNGVKA